MRGRMWSALVAICTGVGLLVGTQSGGQQARADDFSLIIGTPGFGLYIGRGTHVTIGQYWWPVPVYPYPYYGYSVRHWMFHRFGGVHYGPHSAPHIGPYWHPVYGYIVGPHAGPHVDWHGIHGHTGPIVIWGF